MSNSRIRGQLIHYTKRLIEQSKDTAGLSGANNDDRKLLQENAELLTGSVEALIKIIETYDALVAWTATVSQEDKARLSALFKEPVVMNGMADLSSVLAAAMWISANCFDSPIYRQEEKNTRALRARKGRELKSRQLDRDILNLAKPHFRHQTWSPGKIADEIAESLNKGRERPLKNSAIEKRVRNLKARTTS